MRPALPRWLDLYAGVAVVVSVIALADAITGVWNGRFLTLWQLAAPVAIVIAQPLRVARPWVLALGSVVIAGQIFHDGVALTLLLGLAFLGVLSESRGSPWVTLVGGLIAGAIGVGITGRPVFGSVVGAVVIGAGAAMLVKYSRTTRDLVRETRRLRQQTAWLEQRTALARELHDVVGHHVTAMVVQAEAGRVGDPQGALARIGDVGRAALGDLDRLVVHLRDPSHDLTLSAPPRLLDIDEVLAPPLRHSGLEVRVDLPDDPGLGDAQVLAIYRIAQEGLTNIARHAGARRAWVTLSREGRDVRLTVGDDGVGTGGGRRLGAGLVGIRERAAEFGGTAELRARPGGGTLLEVRMAVAR